MKRIILIILMSLFTTAGLVYSSCGNKKAANTEQQGKEYTSEYVCPMHCEGSGSHEPGKCPVCGMDYVKNEEHQEDGHTH